MLIRQSMCAACMNRPDPATRWAAIDDEDVNAPIGIDRGDALQSLMYKRVVHSVFCSLSIHIILQSPELSNASTHSIEEAVLLRA